ncbi:MAG TPA: aldolase [Gaiellales bacterium]|nr:aldolase [Gaiellales bacterium]
MELLSPTHDPATVRDLRVEMAVLHRAAAAHGFNEGIDNHFSLALPGRDDLFLLNRYGPHWAEMRAADILTIDLDGNVVDGHGSWEVTAFMIHRAVHRAAPGARCVLHTHMPYATALSMTVEGLDTRASQNAMYFHGRIARAPYGGLADGSAEGDRLGAAVTEGAWVVMLDNHGVLVIGETPAAAWQRLYFLERACEAQVLARSTGAEPIRVPEAVAQHTAAQFASDSGEGADLLLAAERRLLDRDNPGYDAG